MIIRQWSLDDNQEVNSYNSITQASRVMGVDESTIRKAIKYNRATCGYKWTREEGNYNIQEEKAIYRPNNLPKILLLDIETSPLRAYIYQKEVWKANVSADKIISEWFILTFSCKWLFSDEIMSERLTGKEAKHENDSRIVTKLWKILNEADIVIAHNGLKFDVPNINTRFLINGLQPTKPYKQIDTLMVARKQFGFTHNSLNALAKLFKIDGKLETNFELWEQSINGNEESLAKMELYNRHDVEILEDVYLKLRPWIQHHPNLNMYMETNEPICACCGSEKIREYSFYYTSVNKYKVYQCECGALSRQRMAETPQKDKKNILISLA